MKFGFLVFLVYLWIMTKEKAEQLIRILEKWIEKGESGKLKRYTLSSKKKQKKK